MIGRAMKRLQVSVLMVAVLATATPVWAGYSQPTIKRNYSVFLPGVDCRGCLTDCGGKCATFCAVINTCTGKFSGSAKATVCNLSFCKQCYCNLNFFKDSCVRVECSEYTVGWLGGACYTASGCIYSSPV